MKPDFALNLSHDGLSLLRRASGGWRVIGEAAFDDPDLAVQVRYLQRTAAELAGLQLASKLIIPNLQVLYLKIEVPALEDAQRRAAIRAALDGRTPYALNDLIFDWRDAGDGQVQVAVVARDTLDEAEAFATTHRFNPVSFVAIPEPGDFDGEPFLGCTGLSSALLSNDQRVEPDRDAIVVLEHAPRAVGAIDNGDALAGRSADEVLDDALDAFLADPEPATPAGEADDDEARDPAGFSTTRRGPDDNAPRPDVTLGDVPSRVTLAGDFHHDGAEPKVQEVTQMAVTAPLLAGDEAAELHPPDDQVAPAPVMRSSVEPEFHHRTAPENDPAHVQRENPFLTTYGARLGAVAGRNGRSVVVMVGLGVLALVIMAGVISAAILDRPVIPAGLWRSLDAPDNSGPPVQTALADLVAPESLQNAKPLDFARTTDRDVFQSAQDGLILASLEPTALMIDATAPLPFDEAGAQLPQPAGPIFESPEQAAEYHAQTGIWPMAPIPPVELGHESTDDLYIASIDAVISPVDAIALPQIAAVRSDTLHRRVASPPAAGTVFDLDENGRVRPSAAGTLSPEGIMIYAGSPAYTPKMRPRSIVPNAPAPSTQITSAATRPIARPDGLVEIYERARLGGRSLAELAKIRPLPRPKSPQDFGVSAEPTELAVLGSPRPVLRASDFATKVANIRAAVAKTAAKAATDKALAAALSKPKVVTIPTRASVAKAATETNAIKLSSVNLIGIFGSTSARRALVRLKSGRFVKVQIGDRLDGGKVAAISAGRLQYVKNGKTYTLELVQG